MQDAALATLPIVIEGVEVWDTGAGFHELVYETGAKVRIPKLSPELEQQLAERSRNVLSSVHLDDITIALELVGQHWSDRKYALHSEAVKLAAWVTGHSANVMEEDYQRVGRALRRAKLYELVEGDLGSSLLLDDWVPNQSIFERVFPLGRVLHLMVGNVPLAGLFTLTRSVLTKNSTLAKLPSRDPVSCLFFARTFVRALPDHPVTKSLSVVYWPGGSEQETTMIRSSDLVCAWGQGKSIQSMKERTPRGVDFLEFGPKESMLLVCYEHPDTSGVCVRAAYDVSVYEQEACFSPQRVFVEGDAQAFAEGLARAMAGMMRRLPAGHRSSDRSAHVQRARLEAAFTGSQVFNGDSLAWTVILAPDLDSVIEHPLTRTIYVHPVSDLKEALRFVHKDTQTVGVSPWQRGRELATELANRGASRVCDVGLVSRPRPGFTHDGFRPMQRMVRWVGLERGLDYKGKFRTGTAQEFCRELLGEGFSP